MELENIFSELNIEKYENIKLKLPNLPSEYIQLTFIDDKSYLKYDCNLPFGQSGIYESPVLDSQILAKGDDIKTVYEFKLNVPFTEKGSLEYFPGDTIGILPENQDDDVQFIIERLGIEVEDCDRTFRLDVLENTAKKKATLPNFIPKVYTIRKVLKECLDFKGVPKKLLLRSLAHYTNNETEKLILNILSSAEGKSEYDKYIIAPKSNILTLLKTFKSCRLPFTVLLEHLTRLMPRPYSIASSPLENPTQITIVFSKLNSSEALTTSYLENIITRNDDTKIRFYFRQNLKKFQYRDEHVNRNVIMISFGTGISPFIGFLDHRKHLLCETNKSTNSIAWLLTGHRYSERNNLYIDRLSSYRNEAHLTELFQAFSRDRDSKFKYIQDVIAGHRGDFVKLFLEDNTILYICGDGNKMLPDIKNLIIKCLEEERQVDEKTASDIIQDKIKSYKYIEDMWI